MKKNLRKTTKKMTKKTDIKTIEKSIGVEFKNKENLLTALTHRSYLNEERTTKEHNERLEFLGDAVIELIVSKFLYANYPDKTEGSLTSFRSATVKTTTLAQTARELELGKYVMMSKGEESTGGREKEYILANTFEATVGAIFQDQGLKACESFVKRVLLYKIDDIVNKRLDIDPKTQFQEIAQEKAKKTPTYQLVSETGPDHDKDFEMGVYIGEKLYGKGKGPSKQRAEEAAAREGLKKLKNETKNDKP